MSHLWTFPSNVFPQSPNISLTAGDGWVPTQAPGAVLALVHQDLDDHFKANIVIVSAQNPVDFTLEDAVAGFALATEDYVEKVDVAAKWFEVSGLTAYGHEMTYVEPGVGALVVSTRLVSVPMESSAVLVSLTASAGADRLDSDYAEIQEVLATLAIASVG